MYPNSHSFFNLKRKMKNELHVPKRPFFGVKIKNEKPILVVAHFFLKMQKASSKTSFGLDKFYFRITSSLQILALLNFIFRFSKWNWKTKIEIIYFYGDLKSTDLLLNYWWIWGTCWQYNKTSFLKGLINTEFSVLQLAVCDINFRWDRISGWIKYCWIWAAYWNTSTCGSHKIMK